MQEQISVPARKMSIILDKAFVTNIVACGLIALGYVFPSNKALLLNMGLFALSGALTNWLAVHMLFEKVPGFYGSGVVQLRFNAFKKGIKQLIIEQFFNQERIVSVLSSGERDLVNYDHLFDRLVEAIQASSLGGMLSMIGGKDAIEPLRGSVTEKLRETLTGPENMAPLAEYLSDQVNLIVDKRLNELSPVQVKDMIQTMIREHLGWLVVWGGVLGGLIGCISSLLQLS